MDDVPPPFGLIWPVMGGDKERCRRWMGRFDRRFWSFSFVSMVTLEHQDAVPTLERGNDQMRAAKAVRLLGCRGLDCWGGGGQGGARASLFLFFGGGVAGAARSCRCCRMSR